MVDRLLATPDPHLYPYAVFCCSFKFDLGDTPDHALALFADRNMAVRYGSGMRAAKLWREENLRPAHPGYASIRIHDLKHTFGRRLRAAGVTEEDRKALLGHKNGSITSHYSGAELGHLIEAANMVSATDSRGPVLTILKRKQA